MLVIFVNLEASARKAAPQRCAISSGELGAPYRDPTATF